MDNAIINKVDVEHLHDWLYTEGLEQLILLSNAVSQTYYSLNDVGDDGELTQKALEAHKNQTQLSSFLSLMNLVKNQITAIDS